MGQGPHPDYKSGSIQRLDRADRRGHDALHRVRRPQAVARPTTWCSTRQGGFYFTDLGKRYARHRDHGGVYYALPDGSKIVCLAYPILSPNGCGLSPDGKMLYVADTERRAPVGVRRRGAGRAAPAQRPRAA